MAKQSNRSGKDDKATKVPEAPPVQDETDGGVATAEAPEVLELVLPLPADASIGVPVQHVSIRLTPQQGRVMNRMYRTLHGQHAKTLNGRHVERQSHVIPWLLDMIAEEVGIE